jgi:hypothetical protein
LRPDRCVSDICEIIEKSKSLTSLDFNDVSFSLSGLNMIEIAVKANPNFRSNIVSNYDRRSTFCLPSNLKCQENTLLAQKMQLGLFLLQQSEADHHKRMQLDLKLCFQSIWNFFTIPQPYNFRVPEYWSIG